MDLEYYPKMFDSIKDYYRYLKKEIKMNKELCFKDLYGRNASEILSITNQEEAVPVDLKKILEKFNISAVSMDFTDIENSSKNNNRKILGALICRDDEAAIFYNCNDKTDGHRYRFTIAHEIAHCCLSKECNHIDFRLDPLMMTKEEVAANTFAGELLIPESSLYDTINKLIFPSITVLADVFEVSINVMRERLNCLKIQSDIFGYNC